MVITKSLSFQTNPPSESHSICIINITSQVAREVEQSGVSNGTVTLFIPGSTAGVTTIEYEPGLLDDFKNMWDRVIPQNIPYGHNKAWGDGN